MTAVEPRRKTSLAARLRSVAPILVVAALFAAGSYALYRLLAPVNLREVMAQVRGMPASSVLLATLTTACGYAALVGYDWSALRYIGKRVPFPVVALGGFLGYAFGNTIGLSAVSGGAVRYRIYAALGLDGFDIAAISTFAALAFGAGVTLIGLGALAYHPGALQSVTTLDPALIRLLSSGILVILVCAMAWAALRGGAIEFREFRIKTPSPGIMGGQVLFTALDVAFAALTLYILLPSGDLGFATFLAVFAAATMAGVLSHVPGGVGVFETVVLAALPASVPIDQAAAALLLYRLIYYLLPFAVAILLLSLNELRMLAAGITTGPLAELGRAGATVTPIFSAVSSVAPIAIAAMVFGSGVWMLGSALIPGTSKAADELELMLPLVFVEGGALLSSAIGTLLIVVAHGLLRRIEGAFWLAIGALAAGSMVALAHGIDYDRAILLAVVTLVLLPCRREFYRSARLTRDALTPGWFALLAMVFLAGGFLIFFAHKGTTYSSELWWQFAVDERAPRAMRAGLLASLGLAIGVIIYALRPSPLRPAPPRPAELERAAVIIAAQDDPDANLALTGDKSLLFADGGDAFIMFGVHGRTWVSLGDPCGPEDAAERLAWQFADAAHAENVRPVFYQVTERYLAQWIDMGMSLHKLGEEAVVELGKFGLEGSHRKSLRTVHNRALRDGLSFEIVAPPHSRELIGELRTISDSWLHQKTTREKRFSVGRFDPDYIRRFPIGLVRFDGRIVAFANVLVTESRQEATVDLMRHLPDTPGGVMEFLFVELMLALKAQGYRRFSLGMAPFAGLDAHRRANLWTRFGALLYRHGGHFYNFDGLRRFKNKFDPEWKPRYLAAPSGLPPFAPLADIAILIAGGVKGIIAR